MIVPSVRTAQPWPSPALTSVNVPSGVAPGSKGSATPQHARVLSVLTPQAKSYPPLDMDRFIETKASPCTGAGERYSPQQTMVPSLFFTAHPYHPVEST